MHLYQKAELFLQKCQTHASWYFMKLIKNIQFFMALSEKASRPVQKLLNGLDTKIY
jgi:hypothetical protein